MRKKFTQQEINSTINLYNNGKQQWEIAQELNCSQTSISGILRRAGIITRTGKKLTYTDINTKFFDNINSEENAYFLGFLYADGCVQIKNSRYQVTLKLKSNDQCIIEKFRDIIAPSSPIKSYQDKKTQNTYSYFRINQKEICEQLISHGCVPNKSLILEFPKTVPPELLRHFLRGYSDGDGTIYKNKTKYGINTIWKIVSTNKFCEQVAEAVKNQLNINCSQYLSKLKKNKITTILSVGGNLQVKKVLDWLYQDATIYLPRKYEKYQEFITNMDLAQILMTIP